MIVKLITCDCGDWEILEVDGVEFASGHHISNHDWLSLLQKHCGCTVIKECITDEQMEMRS